MKQPKEKSISINIVTWQAEKYLPWLLKSIYDQTFNDYSILVTDNNSSDSTVSYLKEYYPQVKVIKNKNNIGFAKAHNQAIHWTRSKYILCLNQDVVIDKYFLENCFDYMEKNERLSALTGKIYQWDMLNSQPTKIIDSTGLKIFKNHKVIDRGHGEIDSGQFDKAEEIFGVSGACPFFRRALLEKIKINYEYFDETFFSYKEDVDLAFRLQLAGFTSFYLPEAIAYHDRTTSKKNNKIKLFQRKNSFVNYHSYKNHLMVLSKNEFMKNMLKYFPLIFFFELKKFFYLLIFETKTLRALKELFRLLPIILKKRKFIKNNITIIKPKDLNKWYV